MGNPGIWIAVGAVGGVLVTVLVMRSIRTTLGVTARPAQSTPSSAAPIRSDESEIVGLRQNLRLKVMYDEAKIDRLIEEERQKKPNASLAQLMQGAIEHWERDNR